MDAESSKVTGGYDNNFIGTDTERYQCPVCLLVLRNAMQTHCGHRFCQSCINRVIGKSTMLKCPVDKQFSKLNQIFPDMAVRREVLCLPVQCSNDECHWQGDLMDYENHWSICTMKEVPCPFNCSVKTRRGDVVQHMAICSLRDVDCQHCHEKIQYCKIEEHISECHMVPIVCSLCNEDGILRGDMDKHKDPISGVCPETIMACPYEQIGCTFTGKRADLNEHITSPVAIANHLKTVSHKMMEDQKRIQDLENMFSKFNAKVEVVQNSLQRLDRKTDGCKRQLNSRNVTGQLHWKVELRSRGEYYSNAFYTGCPGYKVQVTLDDSSREGNIRLWMTVLRGEYDDQMMWPFNATVFATILDQKNGPNARNLIYNSTMRDIPRNRNGSRLDRMFKREVAKHNKEELIGQSSRFLKNCCLFVEVSVVHCVTMSDPANPPLASITPVSLHAISNPIGHQTNSPGSPVFSLASLSVLQQ